MKQPPDSRDPAARAYEPGSMVAHEVSATVNSPKNNGEELIEPVGRGGRAQSTSASKRAASSRAARNPKPQAGFIDSMECLPVAKIPESPEWTYEIKLYRLATGVWTWNFAGENMR